MFRSFSQQKKIKIARYCVIIRILDFERQNEMVVFPFTISNKVLWLEKTNDRMNNPQSAFGNNIIGY